MSRPGTFQPGNTAAQARPERKMMTQQLIALLNEQYQGWKLNKTTKQWTKDGKPQNISNMRRVLENLLFNATELRDQAAINAIFDRLEGKPVQGISGPEGEPLEATTFIIKMNHAKAPGVEGLAPPAHHAMAKDTTGQDSGA